MKKYFAIFALILFLLSSPGSALAQDYYFQLPQKIVHAYWNADGTLTLDYTYVFQNDPMGHAIEYVDVGLPNSSFNENNVSADVNGQPVAYISKSEFQGDGPDGVAVALGSNSIPPGKSGTVRVRITGIRQVIYQDSQDSNYASAVLIPNYFISSVVYGKTDTTVTFHFPPGILPDEPRWHEAPSGFPPQPAAGIDAEGRIFYTWRNANANASSRYEFGASFPKSYVPASAITRPNPFAWFRENADALIPIGFFGFFGLMIGLIIYNDRRRQLQYLPPKISIEGHGIKRGLTAVEAAILLEQPLDKVLTMILFGLLKKGAAQVLVENPLQIEALEPQPGDLHTYEIDFLKAFKYSSKAEQQKALSSTMISLVKSVAEKIKGFSRKESIDYYRNIVERAWAQVQQADTPEVKSRKYDELMEWTMLDRNYEGRTRDIFQSTPVYVPSWWGRYSPAYRRTSSTPQVSLPQVGGSSSAGKPSLPHLPGSDFAASVVNGVSNFSANVVGNVTQFTNSVTKRTNPVPVTTSSGSGRSRGGGSRGGSSGGRSCACACACAGCACACAGGGR